MIADPGMLRHRVILQQPVRTSDGTGGSDLTFADVATVWAAVEPLRPTLRLEADQPSERLPLEVTIRFRADIASGWRILHFNRALEVEQTHDPDERRAWLVCTVWEEGR